MKLGAGTLRTRRTKIIAPTKLPPTSTPPKISRILAKEDGAFELLAEASVTALADTFICAGTTAGNASGPGFGDSLVVAAGELATVCARLLVIMFLATFVAGCMASAGTLVADSSTALVLTNSFVAT